MTESEVTRLVCARLGFGKDQLWARIRAETRRDPGDFTVRRGWLGRQREFKGPWKEEASVSVALPLQKKSVTNAPSQQAPAPPALKTMVAGAGKSRD